MTVFDGIRFNGKHSYRDYGMWTSKPPDFGVPETKTRLVDIPGADGLLDLTEAAGGTIRYGNRQLQFVFMAEVNADERDALRDLLNNEIHGQFVTVIADCDPEWYYEGRASVSFTDISRFKMKINISVDAQPYKLAHDMTEIAVGAESFDQVDIYIGHGTNAQVGSSIFYDLGNISAMSKLVFSWDVNCPLVGPLSLSISDGTNSYTTSSFAYDDYGVEVAISELSSLDTTSIKRVVLSGIRFARLYKRSAAGALLTVINDRMPVVPYWENPNSGSIVVHVNGQPFTIGAGEKYDPDIVFEPGENELALTSASVPADPLVVRFRKGRL